MGKSWLLEVCEAHAPFISFCEQVSGMGSPLKTQLSLSKMRSLDA